MSAMILANSLYENGIDFFIKEDKTKFFNSFILNDVLAFLKLSLDPTDRESFSKIYYKSYTYFNKNMCRLVLESPHEGMTVFNILSNCQGFDYYVYDRIEQFRRDINYLSTLKPKDSIKHIRNGLEYMSYLERMQDEGRNNMSNSLHILEILEEIGSYCSNIKEFMTKIYSLQGVIKNSSSNKGADVTLTTIHSAKGLEYDHVYMIDNIDGEFPLDRKNNSGEGYVDELEEERRIFYVGMTRARRYLNIIVPGIPSLFVNELLKSNKKKLDLNMDIGQKVKHKKFGKGTIVDIKDSVVYIKFNEGKTKGLDINISLEKKLLELI
jgi:DNA helicase-2/ATP-dependent DNA helicase PcrA